MAFITTDMVVVSRGYIWNNIVSIAEKVLNAAYRRSFPVIMYIEELEDFRSFDPVIVFEHGETNVRDGEVFYNIHISIGTKLEDSKLTRLEDFEGGG